MLAGDLREFTLEDLFQLLALTRKTGALRLTCGDGSGRVHFLEGEIAFALADDRRLPLGARLVAAGYLSADRLEGILVEHRGVGAAGLAVALLQADELDDATRSAFIAAQIHEALFHLSRVDKGPFTFDADDVLDWPGPLLAAGDVLAEARRRLAEWSELSGRLPADDAVLVVVPNPPGEGPMRLERSQWHLLALIDGRRHLSELAELSGNEAFYTAKIAASLVEAGLVEVAEDGGALARLLAGRAALRRLEEVALGASNASGARGDQTAKAIGGLVDGDAVRQAAGEGRLAWASAAAEQRKAMGHRTDLDVGDDEDGDTAGGAGEDQPDAEDDSPWDELAASVEADAGAADDEDPDEDAGDGTAEGVDGQRADDDLDDAADSADDAADESPESEDSGQDEPQARARPAFDRAQVARELASLGLDEAEAAHVEKRVKALANGAPRREGESDEAVEVARKLSHDEDVNQGLLLRLIDGVKGA